MAALYYSPPLFPASRSYGLLKLLAMPQEQLAINYRNKIKQLDVDVPQLLYYKNGPDLGYFDLGSLVELTAQLKNLHLYHRNDIILINESWPITPNPRFTYPSEFFDTLDRNNIRLRSWNWNCRFLKTPELLQRISEVHLRPAFQVLRELTLVNIGGHDMRRCPEGKEDEIDEEAEIGQHILASAISDLPNLHSLHFERCMILRTTLLSRLPHELHTLSIRDCYGVTPSSFGIYLSSHGQSLKQLFLSHNRNLNLSFTVSLAKWCPRLQVFDMDITFQDPGFLRLDPHFEKLLEDSEIPSWPAALQSIKLKHFRRWDGAQSTNFFASLIDAAPELPDLRKIDIQVILTMEWRDRAAFRRKWIHRIEDVFLRKTPPPNPNTKTVRKRPELHSTREPSGYIESMENEDSHGFVSTLFGSVPQSSASTTPSTRKSTRIALQKVPDLAMDSSVWRKDDAQESATGTPEPYFRQGMCDVVHVRIDNLRPTDTQYNENDFLDDEKSGDDDWDGSDLESLDGYAW